MTDRTRADEVEAAWETLYDDLTGDDPLRLVIARHRPLIEAALREAGTGPGPGPDAELRTLRAAVEKAATTYPYSEARRLLRAALEGAAPLPKETP